MTPTANYAAIHCRRNRIVGSATQGSLFRYSLFISGRFYCELQKINEILLNGFFLKKMKHLLKVVFDLKAMDYEELFESSMRKDDKGVDWTFGEAA